MSVSAFVRYFRAVRGRGRHAYLNTAADGDRVLAVATIDGDDGSTIEMLPDDAERLARELTEAAKAARANETEKPAGGA